MQNGLQLINSGGSVLVELGLSIIEIYVNQHTQKIAILKFQYELLFMLFYHWVYYWYAFRSDLLCPRFLWVFYFALGLIYKRIVKVLSNWYEKSLAMWKLILWATFSATLHHRNRILASTRKERTKKSPKLDSVEHYLIFSEKEIK